MRLSARVFGIVLMIAATAVWLWLGFAKPFWPDNSGIPLLVRMIGFNADSQMGLTFPAMMLIGCGYFLWRWGKGESLTD